MRYLIERVEGQNNVLYLLRKYRRGLEWFRRDDLLQRMQADPGRSEAIVNRDLRAYLFDQGIDFPFLEPASPSGEADVVADLNGEDPLVLEIKLFDPARGYNRQYIRKGFRQIYEYAVDHGQAVGYYAIYNCTKQPLIIRTSNPSSDTLRIDFDNRTFFLVIINLGPSDVSASKRVPIQPAIIEESYLTAQHDTSDDS